jgi:quercetin dioxygenase-like cupin family protein
LNIIDISQGTEGIIYAKKQVYYLQSFKISKEGTVMMKKIDLDPARNFHPEHMKKFLVHDSAYFRIINFNLGAGVVFPVHSHDLDGQLSILVIEGEGEFLGKDDAAIPAKTGDILISDIQEPHGVRAVTNMRIIVTIAPPI